MTAMVIRAGVTVEEWAAMRILAITLGTTTQALVAEAIRAYIETHKERTK